MDGEELTQKGPGEVVGVLEARQAAERLECEPLKAPDAILVLLLDASPSMPQPLKTPFITSSPTHLRDFLIDQF